MPLLTPKQTCPSGERTNVTPFGHKQKCPKHALNFLCFCPPWEHPWCVLFKSQQTVSRQIAATQMKRRLGTHFLLHLSSLLLFPVMRLVTATCCPKTEENPFIECFCHNPRQHAMATQMSFLFHSTPSRHRDSDRMASRSRSSAQKSVVNIGTLPSIAFGTWSICCNTSDDLWSAPHGTSPPT